MSLRRLQLLVLVLLAGAAPASAATIFAGDIDTDDITAVDSGSAATVFVGNLGQNLSFGGLAYDTGTGTMYVSDIEFDEGYGLASVDLATGDATFIGGHVNSINIWGLAYDSANDVLYGADGSNVGLATLDRATGESTLVGAYVDARASLICALAYDAGTDTLYGVSAYENAGDAPTAGRGNGAAAAPQGTGVNSQLFTLNRATGAATLVGDLGVALDASNVRCGLEIDPVTGNLIAGAYDGSLYRVDKSSGAATFIGNTGIAIDALGAPPQAGTWVDIPTLAPGGLLLLALVLAAAAALLLRRRTA